MPNCLQCHTSLPATRLNLITAPVAADVFTVTEAPDPPSDPTPEPSTLLLVGVTLAYLGRRLVKR